MDNTGEIQQSQLTVKEQIHLQKERMASYEQKKGNDPNAKQAEIVKEVGNIRQMSAINKVNGIRSEINIIASEPKPLLLPEEKTTEEKTERATGSANPNILGKVAGSSAGVIMVILKFIQDRLVEYI